MGKVIKILGWLFGTVILLLVAAVIILPLVVDPNDFKDEIIAQVQKETGRTLQIEGDLKLSVFPWLGLEIGAVTLGNAPGFGEKPFAAAKSAAVRVKLMPLFSKEVEVDTIGVDGLVLNLAKARDGRTNWDDLVGAEKPATEKPAQKGAQEEGPAKLTIGGIDINNGRVSWDDRQSGQHYEVDRINLKSGAIVAGKPVGLELGMVLESADPQLTAQLDLRGTVEIDEKANALKVSPLRVTVDAKGEALPQGELRVELQTAVTMTLDGRSLRLDGLRLDSGELHLSGDLQGRNLDTQPAFSGGLKLAEFNLRDWMAGQGLGVPDTADPKALTRVGADLVLNAKGSATEAEKLALLLDDTHISGKASLRGDAIGFALDVDDIDLDRYLSPVEEGASGSGSPADTAAAGEEPLFPVELLRGLNLNGVLQIQKMKVKGLSAEGVKVTIKASGGRMQVDQQVNSFYQGSYTGRTDIDVQGKTPVLKIKSALSDIQAGPLLRDMTGEERLTGKGRFNAELQASGNSANAVKRSLGGNLNFRFEDGAVKGINLAQTIRELKALFDGKRAAESDEPKQTDFSELSGSGVITGGVLTNRDLMAKSPYLRVDGSGTVNLVNEATNYNLKTVLVNTSKGQGGKELGSLEGATIPVHVSGRYSAPKYSVNWGEVLMDSQKEKLKEKLLESLQGKPKEESTTGEAAAGESGAAETSSPKEDSAEDKLKKKLKDKLKLPF